MRRAHALAHILSVFFARLNIFSQKSLLTLSFILGLLPVGLLPVGLLPFPLHAEEGVQTMHGIAMHGEVLYPQSFSHFSYVNPEAPQGGTLRLARNGAFDSLNPLIVKGRAAAGIREYVYESLMARGFDEPFSLYGLLAESVETSAARDWVAFTLRKNARFSDGSPVRVEDVIFSAQTLREKGRPNHRFYYGKIARMTKTGARRVRFDFKEGNDREMPLIMGLMPILSARYFEKHAFDKTTLKTPLGSGPYIVEKMEAGKRILYAKNPDYWGKELAVNRGRFNFEKILYDYYRDENALFESFKAGEIDARWEKDPSRWATQYDFPARRAGKIRLLSIPIQTPAGMWGIVFNTRKTIFQDPRTREALIFLFNAEWVNQNLFHDLYTRTESFFANSFLSSHGQKASFEERQLLEPFSGALEKDILERGYVAPRAKDSRNREGRRRALMLLQEAGWRFQDGVLHGEDGMPFRFEIICIRRDEERLALLLARQFKRAGIQLDVRFIDSSQATRRAQDFDFDMMFYHWRMSLSPGNEQHFYWSQDAAKTKGSRNYAGVRSPAADQMIEAVIAAKTKKEFQNAVRALDRVLLSGRYVIPLFHTSESWLALSDRLGLPSKPSLYGSPVESWWVKE